jgi:hypothetical protein
LAISSCIRGKWPFWLEMWSAVLPVLGSCTIPPRPAPTWSWWGVVGHWEEGVLEKNRVHEP